jgi:hypothetical protein
MDLSEDRLRDNDDVNNDGDDHMRLSTVTIRVHIDGQKFCGQLAGRCLFVSMLEIPLKLRFAHFVKFPFIRRLGFDLCDCLPLTEVIFLCLSYFTFVVNRWACMRLT